MALSAEFQRSYLQKDRYPRNYMLNSIKTYPSALKECSDRLDSVAGDLFQTNLENVEVSFRDLKPNNGTSTKNATNKFIHTHEDLTDHLGISRRPSISNGSGQIVAKIKDPKCRFIYIFGKHTLARLRITRGMLAEILTFHQVMPDYLDFMFTFGLQSEPRDHRFSSFREQRSFRPSKTSLAIEPLGRSGRQYQLCYNLKGVSLKGQDPEDPSLDQYSIRPAAFYHRFDVDNGNALWIVTKGGMILRIDSRNSQVVTLVPKTDRWRDHIKWLELIVDNETKIAVVGNSEPGRQHRIYTAGDIQKLLMYEETISEVITSLESNVEVMTSLRDFYEKLVVNQSVNFGNCEFDIDDFTSELGHLINDFKLHISRAKALVKVISNRSELVKQQRMERLNKNLENEAIVMRIVTIVTLLYLPATFVSTLFSTDIIKYQVQDEIQAEGTYSAVAMYRWLQVTLPLMFITMSAAYGGKLWAERRANRLSDKPKINQTEEKGRLQEHFTKTYGQSKNTLHQWARYVKNTGATILKSSADSLAGCIPKVQSSESNMALPMTNIQNHRPSASG
uniref:CorA-like transporter domain-containing protein n=1 Tax=Bionectria ochroleuca TaxID=29856 RepID=A0A8H7N3N9_BIOOC